MQELPVRCDVSGVAHDGETMLQLLLLLLWPLLLLESAFATFVAYRMLNLRNVSNHDDIRSANASHIDEGHEDCDNDSDDGNVMIANDDNE